MKRILITGENSYIGTSFESWMKKYPEYTVDTISVRGDEWKEKDFSLYDAIFHVAGIAHIKETKENQQLYYEVNDLLVRKIADKAKSEGVKQFVFLSTMSVYGMDTGIITSSTKPNPKNAYGKSKLQAEEYLESIQSEAFLVTIVRPPMVYGENCKGNYQTLSKLARICPFFPNINNKRSMIFIDNLSIYIKKYIDMKEIGIKIPQNEEYVNTFELFKAIRESKGKDTYQINIFNFLIKLFTTKVSIFDKVFGDLLYKEKESIKEEVNFDETIKETES